MLSAFKQYLLKLKLSPVSRKLYLSDVSRFLSWLSSEPTLDQLSSTNSYANYLKSLKSQAVAPSMLKRTTASLKQFGAFISTTYSLPNPMLNLLTTRVSESQDYIKHFTNYLNNAHLSPLTIKSYKSDITRYLDWSHANLPGTKFDELLSKKNIEKYLKYLSEIDKHTSSTIERKSKSLSRIKTWYHEVYSPNFATDNKSLAGFRSFSAPQRSEGVIETLTANPSPDESSIFVKNNNSRIRNFSPSFSLRNLAPLLVLLLFTTTLAIFGYQQFSKDVRLTSAFPNTPVAPNRQLSFQGRLEDASGTPITTATDLVFKLWDDATVGSQLYSTGVCSLTPDTDGVFSTQIGSTCGSAIASSVFTENASVWLEVTVGTSPSDEVLTPRQPIASVAYALNSETIQGFPISATVSAVRNTVVPMNQWGEIIVGEQSPRLTGVSGTFAISAPSLSLTTTTGTNGNITLAPDGTGQINFNGNTTSTNFFNVSNAQLTTGSLITGTVANNNSGFNLIDLFSGSSPTSKFSVDDAGNTTIAGDLTITGDNLFMTTNTSGMLLIADGTNYNPTSVSGDITLTSGGVTTIGADKITEGMLKSVNAPTDELCLSYESTVGDFEWQTCGSGGGGSNWRLNLGTISPNNDTLDLLVGGIATSSAKAGFININSGTPTATVSAGVAGGSFLTADGYLSTTARQSLTLGNSSSYNTTGNILLHPSGGANLLFGDTSNANSSQGLTLNQGAFDNEILTFKSSDVAHGITGQSETDSYGVIQKSDANSGGLTIRGIKDADGNPSQALKFEAFLAEDVTDSKGASNQGLINFDTGVKPAGTFQDVAADGNLVSISNNSTTKLIIDAESTIHHIPGSDISVDLATVQVTDTPTLAWNEASDIFTFSKGVGFGGTTYYISSAGNSNLNALTLPNASSLTFGTTTLGETTSALDSGAYVVGTFDEFANSNSLNVQDVLDDLDSGLTTALAGTTIWTDAGAYLYPTSAEVLGNSTSGGSDKLAGIYLADSAPLTFGTDNDIAFSFSGSTLGSTLAAGSMIGIGTTTALATLDVRSSLGTIPTASISGNTSQATLVVDQSGIGDIFTASSSGETRFVVKSNGNVGIGVSDPTSKLAIGGATSTISNASGDITIDSASNFISFSGDSVGNILNGYFAGEVGIGVADAVSTLHVHGATTGKALTILNELGDQNILTASSSGTTRFNLGNDGSLSLDGDYLNFGLTAGTSGYGFRDNAGTMEFKNLSGSWDSIGSGGSSVWAETTGVLSPTTLGNVVAATTSATTALTLTQTGAFKALLVEDEAADATPFVIDQSGNVGIGVASPTQKLEVNGYAVAQRFEDSASASYYLDAAATGTSLSIDGNIVGNGAFYLSTGNDAVAVSIGTTGAGKLDAGTIDPPYTINGEKFATYMTSMTGVKEETTGVVTASEYVPGVGYRATLDFASALTGSDLWLFSKVSSLSDNLDKLVVLLSGNGQTWYDLDALSGKLYLYAKTPSSISYRLTAPRFDSPSWLNTRDSDSIGFVIDEDNTWSVPESIANLFNTAPATPISPLGDNSLVVIDQPLVLSPSDSIASDSATPLLTIDGTLDATTISARVAQLETIQADTITAKNIVADTIEANHIIGLDAKIASLSGMTDDEFDSITDRIKDRLATLTGNEPSAEDVPLPEGVSQSNGSELQAICSEAEDSSEPCVVADLTTIATSSANIDFATINDYLAVIGTATITTLNVTDTLYVSSLSSQTGILALADNTLIIDSTGHVGINGDLTVSGKILADSAEFNSLSLGTPDASASALGQLLSIYNEQGLPVATIDASGSANLASLTTNMITIASAGNATSSSLLATGISTNATAGEATLISPNTELTIESPYLTGNSLVYLTPTGNTDNKVLFVKSKLSCDPLASDSSLLSSCTPSFTVGIDAPASSDISFNWWIIQLSPPKPSTGVEPSTP